MTGNSFMKRALFFHSTLDFDRLMRHNAFKFNSLILAQTDDMFGRLRA